MTAAARSEAPGGIDRIVLRSGTYRVTDADRTWERIRPVLPRLGITRVADITDLEDFGIPTHTGLRPTGTTVAVSMGMAIDPAQSRVSAAMESIEAWHAENPLVEPIARGSAREVGLPYDVRSLNLAVGSLLTEHTVLDWVAGTGLLTGARMLVPADLILLDSVHQRTLTLALFVPTSNGNACGNSTTEAALHGLLELVERDCISDLVERTAADRIGADPDSSTNEVTGQIVAALHRTGCRIELMDITNAVGVPCYSGRIWADGYPANYGGFGCHLDPQIAAGRALGEAMQSRLAAVAGARDDIVLSAYDERPAAAPPPDFSFASVVPIRPRPAHVPGSATEALARSAERVRRYTGVEPFVVDLTHPDLGIPAVKVFAPGLRLFPLDGLSFADGDA